MTDKEGGIEKGWMRQGAVSALGVSLLSVLLIQCMAAAAQTSVANPGRARASATTVRGLADLTIRSAAVRVESSRLVGTVTVRNVGTVGARATYAGVLLQLRGSRHSTRIGRFRVPALPAGVARHMGFAVAAGTRKAGSYMVSVCADVLGQVREESSRERCRDAGTVRFAAKTAGKPAGKWDPATSGEYGSSTSPSTSSSTSSEGGDPPDGVTEIFLACGAVNKETLSRAPSGSVYVLDCPVTVESGETVRLREGVVVKAEGSGELIVDGRLDVEGTASDPVTITSINDQSVGGETGSGSPQPGEWGGIVVQDGGSAAIKDGVLEYASTAVTVRKGATVSIEGGSILRSNVGVRGEEFVEAREVNWGSGSGPEPVGTGTRIEGEVLAPRWVGYTPFVPPTAGPAPSETDETTCRDVLFLGVRGSNAPPQGGAAYSPDELDNMGQQVEEVEEGLQGAVGATTIRPVAVRYRALPAEYLGSIEELNLFTDDGSYLENIWEGVYSLEQTLAREEARCPSEKIVLSGYSAGALVIHLALAQLDGGEATEEDRALVLKISAIALVADPAQADGEGMMERTGTASAAGEGVYTRLFGAVPIAAALAARTIELCDEGDIVCATGPGANEGVHDDYASGRVETLGEKVAAKIQ
jgi:hypothetical protein